MPGSNMAAGGVFFVVWGLMMLGMFAGYLVLLIAIWRGMKAHESVARTLADIARTFREPKA
jgi:hypothetical protein